MTARRHSSSVIPLHNDKYYVYALFKPNSVNPFYIGKGIRGRINDHFKESNLKRNNPKVNVIRKYRNSIRREILCYFDSEDSAYCFEEYMISLYGLISEGGCLTNYAKSRHEYSGVFIKEVSSRGYLLRERKYSKEDVEKALTLFYIDNLQTDVVSKIVGIPENYLGYVLRGVKCKYDFNQFKLKHTSVDFDSIRQKLNSKRLSKSLTKEKNDPLITELFELVCGRLINLEDAANVSGLNAKYLSEIFLGKARGYLCLDYDRYKSINKGKHTNHFDILKDVSTHLRPGLRVSDIILKTGYSKTTVYRAIKELSSTSNYINLNTSKTAGDGTSTDPTNIEGNENNLENTG